MQRPAASIRPTVVPALVLLTVAVLFSGCMTAPLLHERNLTLAAGAFAEVNLLLPDNGTVHWEWSTSDSEAMRFNLHSHGAGGVQEHLVHAGAASHSDSFKTAKGGSYSLMWENTGRSPLELAYKVTGDGRLDPAHPPVPR